MERSIDAFSRASQKKSSTHAGSGEAARRQRARSFARPVSASDSVGAGSLAVAGIKCGLATMGTTLTC